MIKGRITHFTLIIAVLVFLHNANAHWPYHSLEPNPDHCSINWSDFYCAPDASNNSEAFQDPCQFLEVCFPGEALLLICADHRNRCSGTCHCPMGQ